MIQRWDATPATDPVAVLGEGPCWIDGAMSWVDITGCAIHTYDIALARDSVEQYDDTIGFALPRRQTGRVLGIGAAVTLESRLDRRVLCTLGGKEIRCNDAVCGPDGSLYVGTMRRDGLGRSGGFYRVSPSGSVEQIYTDIGISNGIAFDLERERAYYVDSADQRVDVIDLQRGWESREPFILVDWGSAVPDGLTLDERGWLWLALWDGGQVRSFDPDGNLRGTVELPASRVTSCAFGGSDFDRLFITTAREGLTQAQLAEQPLAGALFVVDVAARGLPPRPFAG